MKTKNVLEATLVALVVIILAWYLRYRYRAVLVANVPDGATVILGCTYGPPRVTEAWYRLPGGKPKSVAKALESVLGSLGGSNHYTVDGKALGQAPGGSLTFRYRCGSPRKCPGCADGFRPVPITTCGSPYDDHYAVDMTGRNAAGTVVWDPYSTQSRISLERYAETPEAAEMLNPYTGLGKTASVRAMGDRYRRGEALGRLSAYEHHPGEPGYMEEVDDGEMSLLRDVARRSPSASPGAPSCLLAGADADSEFLTDGFYGEAVLQE
jgi:hypothetical protein